MTLQIPDSIATQSGCGPQELLLGLVVGLFVNGHLSLGQAGSALGLSRPDFQQVLGRLGVAMPYDEQDARDDLQTLSRLFPATAA
jgi:predicted HTH domain antitoxin